MSGSFCLNVYELCARMLKHVDIMNTTVVADAGLSDRTVNIKYKAYAMLFDRAPTKKNLSACLLASGLVELNRIYSSHLMGGRINF